MITLCCKILCDYTFGYREFKHRELFDEKTPGLGVYLDLGLDLHVSLDVKSPRLG